MCAEESAVPTRRRYRFGVLFGLLNVLAGAYYGWHAVTHSSSGGAAVMGLYAFLTMSTGVGLLRKRRYGILLMILSFCLLGVQAVEDWFKPHSVGLMHYILVNAAFFAAMFAVVVYFHKRQHEFS